MKAGRKKATDKTAWRNVSRFFPGKKKKERMGRTYNDFLEDEVLAARPLVDEVGDDTHDNDRGGPLHESRQQLQGAREGRRDRHGVDCLADLLSGCTRSISLAR